MERSSKKNFYDEKDLLYVNYENDLGNPGEYPYTRGAYKSMYRDKLWTMRMYAGYGSAKETNQRYKYLINEGITGLSVAFDLPTQLGLDSDNHISQGEVGKVGVAIDSLEDMEELFDGIKLQDISTSMTINASAIVLLAMYIAVGKKQGAEIKKLRGTIQNDILKEYVARGTYIYPVMPSLRIITDIFSYCYDFLPEWNSISVSGYHMREAGATGEQEVAFTIANAMQYIDASIASGIKVDRVAPRFSFFFAAHNNLFEEVAKFRAARRVWARMMKEKYKASNPKSMIMKFHVQTAGSTLTAQDPENNVVRVAIQSLAGILGGAQSLHTNSKDEAFALPSQDSVKTALRTQQVIAHESGISDTGDPLGGSYYVESLTNKMEYEIVKIIDKIEKMGGSAKAIENGYIENEISDSAYLYQKKVESGEIEVVGINIHNDNKNFHIDESNLLRVDETIEQNQLEKLKLLKSKRDKDLVDGILRRLKRACQCEENLMPLVIEAVEAYATVGEICGTMKEVFGEYKKFE